MRAPDPLPEPLGWRELTILQRFDDQSRVRMLDAAIGLAIRRGMPHWHTEGTGGDLPSRKKHIFGYHCHAHGARADFFRGTCADDLLNETWVEIYLKLPDYVAYVNGAQGARNLISMGNAMESLIALCFHAATDGQYLPGYIDWTGGGERPSSQPYFALAWWHF